MTTKLYTGQQNGCRWICEITPLSLNPQKAHQKKAVLTAVNITNEVTAKYERSYMLGVYTDLEICRDMRDIARLDDVIETKSLLDRANWDEQEAWYTDGTRVAWWDRHIKMWTSYLIDHKGNQRTPAQYYSNRGQFELCEEQGHFEDDARELREAIDAERWG